MVKSLSESTTISLIVLSDSDDVSEACTVVKNTNVKLEEVNFIDTKFRFLNSLKVGNILLVKQMNSPSAGGGSNMIWQCEVCPVNCGVLLHTQQPMRLAIY